MAKIALRAYNREIETLIDRGQIEEAIAHCKYILRFFPKHVETYRLLGKAYIESQRYSEAADILQRILSVLPDDFIAQVGMSIIREDENNLDAAIFHMEHAHEIQPSNAAVQDELRRLYGRRDGVEPPRLRLTRGALVRLYAKGDLYRQAIAEIRAALTEDPNRFDLEVVLARMYYLLGQKVEATDIASRLVSKLPYCMEANRILAEILPTTSRADDAKTYQARVFSLDPYLAYISTNAPTINLVPDNAVTLDHLEFQPTAAGEEQPAWAQTAGIDIGGAGENEAVPDWMTAAPETARAYELEAPNSESLVEPTSSVSTEMPEWMQGAGWSASTQGVQETPKEDEEAAEPGELPDWLKQMAPPQETTIPSTDSDLKLDWLDQVLPEADSTQTRTLELPVEEKTHTVASGEESGMPAAEASAQSYEETLPAWLNFPEQTPAETEPADVASEIEQPTSEAETVGEVPSVPEAEQPTAEIQPAADVEVAEVSPENEKPVAEFEALSAAEIVPELEQPTAGVEQPAPELEVPTEIEPAITSDGVIAREQPIAEVESISATEPAPEFEQPSAEIEPQAAAAELPSIEVPEEEKTKPVRVIPTVPASEPTPAPAAQAEPQTEPDWSDLDSAMAWLEGLAAKQGADADTLSTTADERPEAPPDWVIHEQENAAAVVHGIEQTSAPVAEAQPVQLSEMELPSPGLNVEAAPEMPIEAAVEVASEKPEPVLAEAPSEISTPLTEAQPAEIPAIVEPAVLEEPVANEEPVSESPAPESIEFPPAGVHEVPAPVASGEMDPDAAFAWLESLAAQQGADEATLSTSKEERKIKPPTWVTEASEPSVEVSLTPQPVPELFAIEPEAPVAQEILPEVAFEPPQTPAIPAVELPQSSIEDTQPISVGEWVQEVQQPTAPEPAPEPVLASTSTPVEQEEEPLPAWLQGLDQPPAGTKQLTPPEGMEDLPDWLKGFDTQLEPASVPAPAESASVSSWLNEQDVSPQSDVTPFAPASVEQPLPLEPAYVPSAPIAAASASPEDAGLKGFVPSQNPLIVQAQSHLGSGQVDPALDLYNQVIGQGQDLHAVIQDLTTAAYRYPVDVGLWQTLGDAYKQNDQIQEALDAYTKAEDLLR